MNNYIKKYSLQLPSMVETKKVSDLQNTSFKSGKLEVDTESVFYPQRSDLKIMREDIAACILVIQEMLKDCNYSVDELEQMPLFSVNGSFVDQPEKHLQRMPMMYHSFTPEMTPEERQRKIYKMSPPLLALQTLTNSSMSFIAQYIGLKGQNATFGSTSISGLYALNHAQIELQKGGEKDVLVSASNCGDTYSFLTNSGVLGYCEQWFESAAVGNIMLSNSKQDSLCEITVMKHDKRIPNLINREVNRNWEGLLDDTSADLVVYSGAFSNKEYEDDKAYIEKLHNNTYTPFPDFGNLGAANIPVGLIKGIESFSSMVKTVDVLDRDVYGRESLIRIEKC